MTGTAYAATTPAAQDSTTTGVTMSSGKGKVRYGARLTMSGRVSAPGRTVRLEHAPKGAGWRPVAQSSTDAAGGFRFAVKARNSGAYRTVTDGGAASQPRQVAVSAKVASTATRHVRRGGTARIRGAVKPGLGGRKVSVQARTDGRWRTVDTTRTGRGGRFKASWKPGDVGTFPVRVRFQGDRMNAADADRAAKVRVYRPAAASWYGPGFYGQRTGCGSTLGAGTVGVAHKSLPCGTKITFRVGNRSVTAPVIDRGPYAGNREFDLTGPLKQKLGFGSTGTVWVNR